MNLLKYFLGFLIVIIMGQIYNKYKDKIGYNATEENNYLINKYLLNKDENTEIDVILDQKPSLWIYTNQEYNSRKWKSFHSRSSYDINQPYINVCINTIVEKCGDSFNVFLINENSFNEILDNWPFDMDSIPEPIKKNYIDLAFCKLLYNQGGIIVPASFICKHDLIDIYNNSIYNGPFTFEVRNNIYYANLNKMAPTFKFFGSEKNNNVLYDIIKNLEINVSKEFTHESKFMGTNEELLYKHISTNNISLIDGKLIGTKDNNNKEVTVEKLLGDNYVEFSPNMHGFYIPEEEILTRTKYNWFASISVEEILNSNMVISKHILLSCN